MLIIEKAKDRLLYNQVKFLSKATSDDKYRKVMTGLYVDKENNRTIATDGRRLHILKEALNLNTGLWEVKVSAKEIIIHRELEGEPPNYDRVIPDGMPIELKDWTLDPKKSFENLDSINIFKLFQKGICLSLEYLKDLKGYSWNISFDPEAPTKAVVFENAKLKAVIMPLYARE